MGLFVHWLVRRVDEGPRCRSLANDEQPSLFVFRAVPMHLLAEMGHEAACRHRYRVLCVELVAGCNPPRALEHRDEAVIGMEVRLAENSRLESVENHIRSALGRIAVQHDLIDARRAGRIAPFVLIRQRIDHRLRIEAGEFARTRLDLRTGGGSLPEDQD
jgi:hypothetical protein